MTDHAWRTIAPVLVQVKYLNPDPFTLKENNDQVDHNNHIPKIYSKHF